MLSEDREELSILRKKQSLWLAYGGWTVTTLVMKLLQVLGYSEITNAQIATFFLLATAAHVIASILVRSGIERSLAFDPYFVYIPNWFMFAPLAAYGYYALGGARDIMLLGWLMGLLFLAGYARFWEVICTGLWYMFLYFGLLLAVYLHTHASFDWLRELIRAAVFMIVCTYLAFLLDRFFAQKQHLRQSRATLRERDHEITLLNRKLSKFVTVQLVEQMSKDDGDAFLVHQRRKITIFFSDIRNFSVITDALEPEELSSLLNEYFTAMSDIVLQFGGTLDKLMGDAIMVLFGAPAAMAPAEGALRCIKMADAMRHRLAELNEQWQAQGYPYSMRVRMGINTGTSTVGSFGSDVCLNYTAIGGQVHIAARLQQMAEAGAILLSHATYVLVANAVEVEALGELQLKGLHYPVQVYKLVRLHPDA